MVTGQDLVEWQKVAWGEPLPLAQEQVKTRGHALGTHLRRRSGPGLPAATGTLRYLRTPEESAYVRVDTGVTGRRNQHPLRPDDRQTHCGTKPEQAINRMVQALGSTALLG